MSASPAVVSRINESWVLQMSSKEGFFLSQLLFFHIIQYLFLGKFVSGFMGPFLFPHLFKGCTELSCTVRLYFLTLAFGLNIVSAQRGGCLRETNAATIA